MNDPGALTSHQPPSPPTPAGSGAPDTELIALYGLDWLLLDIEGTTCPVSFVAGTLFPYASENLAGFLEESAERPDVQALLQEVIAAWEADPDPAAAALLKQRQPVGAALESLPYLQWLILQDRKLAPLKELQGLVWERGYERGDLLAPLYPDVHGALERWQASGFGLAVYSSGSVAAQQMLYTHTPSGDLRHLFSHWFDTRIGGKKESSSYTRIAKQLCCQPGRILFISDAMAELKAADAAGMKVLFSDREGNPERDPGPFKVIRSYTQLKAIP
ncbi:acireductone synthase [Cyanobium sp. FGCU-6]|nr:acireductone synthase [Cyanobium sp. FGCU6]